MVDVTMQCIHQYFVIRYNVVVMSPLSALQINRCELTEIKWMQLVI